MKSFSIISIILIIICIPLLVGVIILQIYLSKKENKWLGLLLPIGSFLLSSIPVFGVAAHPSLLEGITLALSVLLIGNIPTIILLLIYFTCRGKRAKSKEIEKMNIQDLD